MSTQTVSRRIPRDTFALRLKIVRVELDLTIEEMAERCGLSQAEMALKIGVSRQSVSNYEVGATENPRRIVLNAWAAATGVPVEWFTGGPDGGQPVQPAGFTVFSRTPAGLRLLRAA